MSEAQEKLKKAIEEGKPFKVGLESTYHICYACGFEIVEREPPSTMSITQTQLLPKKVGKYTIRRQAWDDNWNEIIEDTYFHEECYYKGFIMSIKHGWLYGEMMKAVDESAKEASYRASGGVDHS